jgi:multidrug resistance efflux pump
MTDPLDAIRARHVQHDVPGTSGYCAWDQHDWPCHAAQALAALDEARANYRAVAADANIAHAGWAAARADADALAGSLRETVRLAASGSARAHFDDAGIMQNPPHSGKFAECAAPWCVRNQTSLAAARHILAAHEARGS